VATPGFRKDLTPLICTPRRLEISTEIKAGGQDMLASHPTKEFVVVIVLTT
jgi:hypothetical protein